MMVMRSTLLKAVLHNLGFLQLLHIVIAQNVYMTKSNKIFGLEFRNGAKEDFSINILTNCKHIGVLI